MKALKQILHLGSWILVVTLAASPAVAVDLTVTNVEVTQAIQTPTNTIQLVAQRSTAVRATIGVADSLEPVAGVTGRLHVFVGGSEITPVAGVPAINEPFTAPLAPQRANENHTLNFELLAPTGITASADVDFQVNITPVPGETNTGNNSGFANDLTFVERATPLLFFTRINFTPSGLGLPADGLILPGVGDAFVRGILPVNDADPDLYREGLFPSLTFSVDENVDNRLDGCGSEGSQLLSLLESCRQLIVDSGVGATERVFLYGWVAGNPIDGNGCGNVGGRNAYGNTQEIRHQRSYAHELTHNFGYDVAHSGCAPLDEVGWDVGARLPGNPAGNNTTGRVKPTTLSDIQCGGLLTNQAWIKTGDGGDTQGYVGLLNHPALAPAGGDLATRVLVIQGIFDPTGVQLRQLKPVFRFPWLSRPTQPIPPPPEIASILQLREPFTVRVVDVNGNVIVMPFTPLVADDSGGPGVAVFGAFSVMIPLTPEVSSLEISNVLGMPAGSFVRSAVAPSIQLVAPLPGATLGRMTRVAWDVVDPDTPREQLMFQVAYSADNGNSFVPIGVDQTGTELTFDATVIPPSQGTGLIRVFVSDGLNTSFADVAGLSTNRRPSCAGAVADPATLWPPNHKFVAVSVKGVTDPDGNPVTITPTSILQDEAVEDPKAGSGNTSPDATLSPLVVRAERNGTGNGRIYHIAFTADDGQGGTCTGTVKVCVPHDQRPGGTCVDDGPLFNSLVP